MDTSFNIPIVYQDDHLLVVDKPVNLPVHKNDFMPHDAPYLTKILGDKTGKWIYNVHRLDSKTSGVIVLSFTKEAAHNLTKQFEQKEVSKLYTALVEGVPGDGTFSTKVLVKKKTKFKKPALTHYKTLNSVETRISFKDKQNVCISLVEVRPDTGRWHQIRQHFAQHHFDILGDTHHGDFTLNKIIAEKTGIKRLFLHASEISVKHPESNEELTFKTSLPAEFKSVLNAFK